MVTFTRRFNVQKGKFSIKNFFSKCDQIRRKQRIWSHLLKKSYIEKRLFYTVMCLRYPICGLWKQDLTCNHLQIVDNKAKGRISKQVFQENKAHQIFQKTNISYPDSHSYVHTPFCLITYDIEEHYQRLKLLTITKN